MQDLQPNAIFKSVIERECSPSKMRGMGMKGVSSQDMDSAFNQTGNTAFATTHN